MSVLAEILGGGRLAKIDLEVRYSRTFIGFTSGIEAHYPLVAAAKHAEGGARWAKNDRNMARSD